MTAVAAAPPRSSYSKFRSPEGFLSFPHLDTPNRERDARGVYSAGIHLTVAELAAVEAELTATFCTAFPDETRTPHLPLWRHPDGFLVLFAKSTKRPRVVNEGFRPVLSASAGSRVRLLCSAKPYLFPERAGVALFLDVVQVIALDARDPRRERHHQEVEALRQAVAAARRLVGAN